MKRKTCLFRLNLDDERDKKIYDDIKEGCIYISEAEYIKRILYENIVRKENNKSDIGLLEKIKNIIAEENRLLLSQALLARSNEVLKNDDYKDITTDKLLPEVTEELFPNELNDVLMMFGE